MEAGPYMDIVLGEDIGVTAVNFLPILPSIYENNKTYSHKWWRAELAKLTVVLCYCVYPQNYAFVWVKTQDKAIDGQAAVKDSAFKIILWPPLGSYMSFFLSPSLSSSWWTWMTVVALFQKA